ncbi:23S rRNA (uracil(1939)-C(5))-methyltransferase RlmD [[Clostridium] scindens]|uniref:23S rRNA (uracil(1939)-C(5))-methyltransferase RlmD n=1 Tax=Clostridium scindens (strain JCM 10418 / VPI 12708) TaxID=29347 RepID=UPI0032C17EE9
MQKNELVTVTIEDIGINGEGIGKVDGYTLFIKDAIIGDVVEAKVMKAKKNYGYARLMNILTPSPYRVKQPKCPMARKCGGCQIQEMEYDRQLAFKEDKIRGNLMRIGEVPAEVLDQALEPIVGMDNPFHYRNKAQFPIGTDNEGHIITGFYAGRTHSIIPNTDCALGVEVNEVILKQILTFMEEYKISAYDETEHKGLVRHVLIRYGFVTKEIMVCLVINGNHLPHGEILAERLAKIEGMTSITLSINKEKTNVIMGSKIEPLWGKTYITDYIANVKYQISPLSFYQVNPVQTEKLYGLALEYAGLTGKETVWDLYCGIGTISLFLAQKAKEVYGVEIVPQAIEDARNNAKINGIENARFYVGKAEEVLPEYYAQYEKEHGRKAHADVIVVDPPRKGCEESLLQTMVDMEPERIVYVSCDSATLARDVKFLREKGYELVRGRGVDQFGHTVHVETVALLIPKQDKDSMFSNSGIEKKLCKEICDLAKQYDVDRVILFGSRARGDYKKVSDIDLAVSGGDVSGFSISVDEETSTLLQYDIVNLDGSVQEELREAIKKEGKVLYEKV